MREEGDLKMGKKKCKHEWANSLHQQICMKCGWQPRIDEIVSEALAEQKAKVLEIGELIRNKTVLRDIELARLYGRIKKRVEES